METGSVLVSILLLSCLVGGGRAIKFRADHNDKCFGEFVTEQMLVVGSWNVVNPSPEDIVTCKVGHLRAIM